MSFLDGFLNETPGDKKEEETTKNVAQTTSEDRGAPISADEKKQIEIKCRDYWPKILDKNHHFQISICKASKK